MEPIGWVRTRSGLLRPVYPVQGGGDWPMVGDGQRQATIGQDLSISTGGLITSGGSANTKGAYLQLVASQEFDAEAFLLTCGRTVGPARWSVDVAIGGAGSERVILPDITCYGNNENHQRSALIPLAIKSGTRVAARCQSSGVSASMRITVHPLATGFIPSRGLHRAVTYGFTAANTAGATVDPGATPNTEGAYTQITASTTSPIRLLLVCLAQNTPTVAAPGPCWLVDVAIGAAAAEEVIIPDLWVGAPGGLREVSNPWLGPFPVNIPSGTRLAVRSQCPTGTSPDRLLHCVLIGFD